jgi:hypothetical protein
MAMDKDLVPLNVISRGEVVAGEPVSTRLSNEPQIRSPRAGQRIIWTLALEGSVTLFVATVLASSQGGDASSGRLSAATIVALTLAVGLSVLFLTAALYKGRTAPAIVGLFSFWFFGLGALVWAWAALRLARPGSRWFEVFYASHPATQMLSQERYARPQPLTKTCKQCGCKFDAYPPSATICRRCQQGQRSGPNPIDVAMGYAIGRSQNQ